MIGLLVDVHAYDPLPIGGERGAEGLSFRAAPDQVGGGEVRVVDSVDDLGDTLRVVAR